MSSLPGCDEQKIAIREAVQNFLQNEFGFVHISVTVLLDQNILVIRAMNFVCPAETKVSADRESAALIHEVYTRQFDKSKTALIEQVSGITGKKVVFDQIAIHFESRDLLMTFFLS